ncbi:MAG: 4Fe-4S binding protein, partial [Oscillospiraceae bacterium]|nr:4Fe-4S binding protein [Oscillospiraceae bacterium]
MKRQQIRKLLLIISLLFFPITLYYFSPVLIISAGLNGIINGSFIVFLLLFVLSIPFGRFFCAYLCPAGGLQECTFSVNRKNPKQGRRNYIKYIIWAVWIAAVISCYFSKGKIVAIDFLFETEHG